MQQDIFLEKTVAQVVRDNYRTAGVFKAYGINYCCGGAVAVKEACTLKGITADELLAELQKATQTVSLPANLQYNQWKLSFLMDYLVNVHHAYLKETLPKLEAALLQFVASHQKKMPHLNGILAHYQSFAARLQQQMAQEEETVFPYIRQIETADRHNESYGSLLVKTLRKPLQTDGYDGISQGLLTLRELTNNYQYPDAACTNHRVIFQQLQELDNDLVQHTHLENNVLLPRAAEAEGRLLQGSDKR